MGSDTMRRQQSLQPEPIPASLEAACYIYGPPELGRSPERVNDFDTGRVGI
jgi:hypothetical protein